MSFEGKNLITAKGEKVGEKEEDLNIGEYVNCNKGVDYNGYISNFKNIHQRFPNPAWNTDYVQLDSKINFQDKGVRGINAKLCKKIDNGIKEDTIKFKIYRLAIESYEINNNKSTNLDNNKQLIKEIKDLLK